MRSFLATSNNQYIQDLALREGEYTFSALVKSGGKYSFSLLIGGVWQKFDAPTHTTSWRRIEHTFEANGLITKFNLISDYASGSNPIEVLEPMFESGSFTSDARLHELDVMEVISNAKLEAENAAKAYSDAELNAREVTIKAYADGKVDAEEARAIADAQAKVDALALVEEQARIALQTTMESYADGVVDAEEQARIADVNTKLAAAKDYADSVSTLARTTAESYADGIVSDEEARAIQDATDKMNEAKAHAESLDLVISGRVDDLEGQMDSATQSLADINDRTDWLSPSLDTNINAYMAGSFAVGNPSSGVSAVLTGLGGANDIFLSAGFTDVLNLEGGKIWFKRNGHFHMETTDGLSFDSQTSSITNRYKDTTGNPISFFMGTNSSGDPVLKFYNRAGVTTMNFDPNGINFPNTIPESWTPQSFRSLGNTVARPLDASKRLTLRNAIESFMCYTTSPAKYGLSGNYTAYKYAAGHSAYSEGYRQYEGFKTSSGSRTSNIPNGWYVESTTFMMTYPGQNYGDPDTPVVDLKYIEDGEIVLEERMILTAQQDKPWPGYPSC